MSGRPSIGDRRRQRVQLYLPPSIARWLSAEDMPRNEYLRVRKLRREAIYSILVDMMDEDKLLIPVRVDSEVIDVVERVAIRTGENISVVMAGMLKASARNLKGAF
jgi:hypothetical protein